MTAQMSDLKDIPVVVEPAAPFGSSARSGEKYTTPQGFTAIRDGQKPRVDEVAGGCPSPASRAG